MEKVSFILIQTADQVRGKLGPRKNRQHVRSRHSPKKFGPNETRLCSSLVTCHSSLLDQKALIGCSEEVLVTLY